MFWESLVTARAADQPQGSLGMMSRSRKRNERTPRDAEADFFASPGVLHYLIRDSASKGKINGWPFAHSLRRLTKGKLVALTVVNNNFVTRSNGTRAAERFFGARPADLLVWLLDRLDVPARPAARRSKILQKAA